MFNYIELHLYQCVNRRNYYWFKCTACKYVGLAQRHNIARKRAHCDCKTNSVKGFRTYPEYAVWASMKDRCTRKNNSHYRYYGAKGITVCDKWQNFLGFWEDMGPRPTDEHSIDRIDVNKGYYKENCRWATQEEQLYNRTNTVRVEYRGLIKTLKEWSIEWGIAADTLKRRMYRKGTISPPPRNWVHPKDQNLQGAL